MIADLIRIDPEDLAGLVPEVYAEFRPLVAEGLAFFLRHLAPARQAEIVAAQAALPADAGLLRRLVFFLRACPVLHKLAQVLARDRYLDAELRRHLQELESLEPHTPPAEWQPSLARELASAADEYRICAEPKSLAEGSVAIVVPLKWRDPAAGQSAPPLRGVAKLLRPGITARLDEDLTVLGRLADHLDEHWAAYGLPPLDYRETFQDVADLLTDEVQLRREQTHLRRAAVQFAGQSDVQVPRLLPFCTDSLTAMERVDGRKVTDAQAVWPWQRPALFQTIVQTLLAQVLFSRDDSVLFHGDPHAGNLMASDDCRLAILDWSLAGRLTTDDRVQVSQLLLAAWSQDRARVAAAIAALASGAVDADIVHQHVDAAMARMRWYHPPGPTWAVDLLGTLARAGVRFPPRLLLFRKALLTLEGVLSDVWPAASLELSLLAEASSHLAWELPLRWLKPNHDRDYATHVSTSDLIGLMRRPVAIGTRLLRTCLHFALAPLA
jgi:ubiquinone biosynthesis protein